MNLCGAISGLIVGAREIVEGVPVITLGGAFTTLCDETWQHVVTADELPFVGLGGVIKCRPDIVSWCELMEDR